MAYQFHTTPSLHIGPGTAARIGALAGTRLGPRVLVITDAGVMTLGLVDQALASLRDSGIETHVFDAVEADPSLRNLMSAVAMAKSCNATGVVGFGGGSSMDVAKLTALLAGSGEDLEGAWGVNLAKGPRLPLVLVPTTAGTGSEVTPVAIITIGEDEKRGVSSPVLLPDMAILDAALTLGLPQHITAATGIDAMVHAIEAYTSKSANNNPLSRMLALQALDLLGANIETACFDGRDVIARENMLTGSVLAGMAFANSPVAAVHALAYPIGGMFHIPHGLSNALVLKEVMRFNAPVCYGHYAELAPHVFSDIDLSQSAQGVCSAFIDQLGALSEKVGLAPRLRDHGIGQDALPEMAAAAMKQTRLLVNNPRDVSEADALAIYRAAW
ncbi:MAG: iron-containing alcohol dehydrogenase [Beijerinckiaceae bacterium]|jgi:alcohol dehydrogenase class IV|nr:iron-containing alcohol dehydrogenase [Beijerinckiaceae bacterium]